MQIVSDELDETNQIELITQLRNSLQGQVKQPQETSHQQNVVNTIKTLREVLPKAESNTFSPAWQQILKEIGLYNYLGKQLLARVNKIIQRNNITPAIAEEEITKLYEALNSLNNGINNLISGFKIVRIGAESLQPGECEVGILIPRIAIDNELQKFRKELNDLEFILKHFAEVTSNDPQNFKIRSLSSTDLYVLLEYVPKAGAFLAVAIAYILTSYKNLLEIKKLRSELTQKEVPEDALVQLDKHINNEMEESIKKFIAEEYEKYCVVKNSGRKNELRNSLEIAMNKIANRIDRGFNIEIRVEPIKMEQDSEEIEEIDETKIELNQNIQTILEAQENLEFIKTEGEPILSLPENNTTKKKTKS